MKENEWLETGTATNDVATATKAEADGKRHRVTYVDASFSDSSASALLTLTYGGITQYRYIHGSDYFPVEMIGSVYDGSNAGDIVASLAAGGAGVVGRVNILGFTEG